MRKLTLAFGVACALSACSTMDQTNARKAGYDTIAAYNVVAPLALGYMQNPAADPNVTAQIKKASADAINVIDPLGADLQSSTPITAIEISAAEAAVAALQAEIAKGSAK